MALSYAILQKRPGIFQKLTGVSVSEFEAIRNKAKKRWQRQEGKKQAMGRPHALEGLENHLLALLMYYRTYITQEFLGYLFDCDKAAICRGIKRLEPLLAASIAIKKDRTLTAEKVEELLIDVTEQPIERPKKKQRKHYSGKQKRHTRKTEVRVQPPATKGKLPKIVAVDTGHQGSIHDFTIRKQGDPLPPEARLYVDAGYQGLQHLHQQTELPYKKSKNHQLTPDEKLYNKALARIRIPVENTIRRLKIFRIFKDVYRNKRQAYSQKVNIIAGIVNLKAGYA